MRASLLLALFLAAATPAFADSPVPKELRGRWKLSTVHCRTGELGSIGKAKLRSIESDETEEYYDVGERTVDDELRERKSGSSAKEYCRTIYRGPWHADGKVIRRWKAELVSREGMGGYSCRNTPFPKESSSDRDWPYRVSGNQLTITHRDTVVSIPSQKRTEHFCADGADSDFIYTRVDPR